MIMFTKDFLRMAILTVGITFLAACSTPPESDDAEVGEAKDVQQVEGATKYKADLDESKVEWIGTKSTGWHNGTVNIQSGALQVKDGEIVGGNFVMDMSTIISLDKKQNEKMNAKLTGHLKSPDFFDVAKYPTAKFVLTGMEPTDETVTEEPDERTQEIEKYKVTNPTHEVSGNLTIKGITKGITFPAKITMSDGRIEAIAKFNINRKDWELNWQYPEGEAVLNNTIHLGIKLVATKQAQASL